MSVEAAEIAQYLTESVKSSPTKTLTGGQLSLLIKVRYLDFDPIQYQAKNLRAFVQEHVPELRIVGKAGMDIRYGLESTPQEGLQQSESVPVVHGAEPLAPLRVLLSTPRVWKTFVSPTSPFRVSVQPTTGQIRVVHVTERTPEDWRTIEPISANVLLEVARDFVSELPQLQQDALAETLNRPKWWLPFFDVLRTLSLKSRWIVFRRRSIVEEFERAMGKLERPMDLEQHATPVVEPRPAPAGTPPPVTVDSKLRSSVARRLALKAVEKMSDSELRSLNLPLGYIIDALNE